MPFLCLYRRCLILIIAQLFAVSPALAQTADTMNVILPEIRIEAARGAETAEGAPFAVSLVERPPEALALEPGLSLESVLRGVPGVWINDRQHFALGERVVIRGMGWAAAFGVRGVQAVLDGVPLTLPDGQAGLDIVDPALVRQAEVLRGPASLFWGNAGGGVLFLSTTPGPDAPTVRMRAMAGSYGLRQALGEATWQTGNHRFHAYASGVRRNGYRHYSAGRFTRAGLNGDVRLGTRTRLRLTAAVADQDTEHPGSLTAEEATTDPRQADARYPASRSGKQSTQIQAGGTLLHPSRLGLLTLTAYGLSRRLDNPLPFAYIDLNRTAGGARATWQQALGRLDARFGADAGWQRDDRRNHNNEEGQRGERLTLDQLETVHTLAAFGYGTYDLTPAFAVHAGLRINAIRFRMDDNLLDNGDQSGTRAFSAWSPAVGLSYRLGAAVLFANYSTAFETPTTTELVNRPGTDGGFNPDLKPQRTHGLEVGARGGLPTMHFDVALFRLAIQDRLIPFQTEDGRTYYLNAGENLHAGFEASARWLPHPMWSLQLTYTGSHFVFDEAALVGNEIPGVPAHHLFAAVQTTRQGLRLEANAEVASDMFTDNENQTESSGYAVVALYAGHTGLRLGRAVLQPFLRLSNLLDAAYVGSLVVNASGGRYFEPAPGRTFEAGLNLTLP